MAKEHALSDMVTISNPDLPGEETATASYKAFKEVWEDKGFKLVEDEDELRAEHPRKVEEPEKLAEAAKSSSTGTTSSSSSSKKDDDK